MTINILVDKQQLANAKAVVEHDDPLNAGKIRLHIDCFAFTANNITYAAMGASMNYWQFYPVNEKQGIIPVWGFARVTQSTCADIAVGERFYGYYPMADSVVLTPMKLNARGFTEGAAHRQPLAAVYNQYVRCSADPYHAHGSEALQALLRPLVITSWLIDDFLGDNQFFGADTVLLSSASSKTAYGTAFMLKRRANVKVIGLTSESNRAFCDSLKLYDAVLSYEQLVELAADTACVYLDFSGNASLRERIHHHFSALAYDCAIGATHVQSLGGGKHLPGPRPTMFFAPAQIEKRLKEWGPAGLGERLVMAWQALAERVTQAGWIEIQTHHGEDAVLKAYAQVLQGKSDARVGHVMSLG